MLYRTVTISLFQLKHNQIWAKYIKTRLEALKQKHSQQMITINSQVTQKVKLIEKKMDKNWNYPMKWQTQFLI